MTMYVGRCLHSTTSLAISFLFLISAGAIMVFAASLISKEFYTFVFSWNGLIYSSLVGLLYFGFCRHQSINGFGPADKLLYSLALGFRPIMDLCFELDRRSLTEEEKYSAESERHVFVAGLARSGTTILMRRFYLSGAFTSLTYRDMPFVLCPKLWRQLSLLHRHELKARERAHGDRITVNADSPEALDEPFWRLMSAEYIGERALFPYEPDQRALIAYRDYIAVVLRAKLGGRYLSKNNNNILRIKSIGRTFPNSTIFIPFRAPLIQASSLLRQHRRFKELQMHDPFVKRYMSLLGHHEFGLDHRAFSFEGKETSEDPQTLEYWVHLWVDTYRYLAATAPDNAIFVCYEDLCGDPRLWQAIEMKLNIPPAPCEENYFVPSLEHNEDFNVSDELKHHADNVYSDLRKQCSKIYEGILK